MQIVKAFPKDAETVGSIHSTAWQQAYEGIFPDEFLCMDTAEKRAQEFIDSCSQSGILYYMIYEAQQAIGIVKLCALPASCELLSIYILQEYRGKGYGKQVMNFLKKEFDTSKIYLWVLEKNSIARHFYKRNGFQNTGRTRTILRGETYIQLKYEFQCS